MRIGIAADHGGFAMKERIAEAIKSSGNDVTDFGALLLDPDDLMQTLERKKNTDQQEPGGR
jgi:ribose 5-phosphate isomerase RpiB